MDRFLLLLRSNWITATGAVLATLSFMAFVTTWIYLFLHGAGHGAYVGLIVFLVLPALFVLGLVLVPLGLWVFRTRLHERLEVARQKPMRLLRVLAVLTLVNLATVGTAGYEAVHYLDSRTFCGTACHGVMGPTYTMSLDAPHSSLACVECHIGPGFQSYLRAKLGGLRQVAGVVFGTHDRPIPTPVHGMPSAQEVCAECHSQHRSMEPRLVVRHHFADDDEVTQTTDVLLLAIGGTDRAGKASGIHWHADPRNDVSYVSVGDDRETIPWIRYTGPDGKQRVFTVDGEGPVEPPAGELRRMDCIDCHNRPAHYQQEPEAAVDEALAAGTISRQLPAIRKHALAALQQEWQRDTAAADIQRHLEQAYAGAALDAARQQALRDAAATLAAIWLRNVHPEMKVTWGTYPSFAGHRGCMRCHDGQHIDQEGEAITFDCAKCHTVLAENAKDVDVEKLLHR